MELKKKQAEKLKSCEMKEGWMKNDEGWWFQAVEGFWFMTDRRTDERTDICDCRVAFATEKENSVEICLFIACAWTSSFLSFYLKISLIKYKHPHQESANSYIMQPVQELISESQGSPSKSSISQDLTNHDIFINLSTSQRHLAFQNIYIIAWFLCFIFH